HRTAPHNGRSRGQNPPHAPADIGDAAADALPHVHALDQGLRWIDLDLDAALGCLLDLFHPGLQRVRGPPSGRRVLVGKRQLDLLCRRRPRPGKGRSDQASQGQGLCLGHVRSLPHSYFIVDAPARAAVAIVPVLPRLDKRHCVRRLHPKHRLERSGLLLDEPVRIEIVCDLTCVAAREFLQFTEMPSDNKVHVIASADLQRFASALFAAAGVAPPMADEWAKSLVWANLRGVDSHGVLRIPGYIERLKTKAINPAPDMRVEQRAGAVAVLEADRAPGAVAMA